MIHYLRTHLITGNIAIDAAIVILCLIGAKHLLVTITRNVHRISKARSRTRKLTSELSASNEKLATLRKELASARRNTEEVLTPYLEDLDNRRRVAAASGDGERDPRFSDLEVQLTEATAKPRYPGHH